MSSFAKFFLQMHPPTDTQSPRMKTTHLKRMVQKSLESRPVEEIATLAGCSATSIRNAANGMVVSPRLAKRIARGCKANEIETMAVVSESFNLKN